MKAEVRTNQAKADANLKETEEIVARLKAVLQNNRE
jgi:hypothetical protein